MENNLITPMIRIRPTCKRCGGPLDLWSTIDENEYGYKFELICNNPNVLDNDDKFWEKWDKYYSENVEREVNNGK